MRVRSLWRAAWLAMFFLLGGCSNTAILKNPSSTPETYWQGRLSVKVFSNPVQAFTASFELQGQPSEGELILTSPLGSTLARMRWTPSSAVLISNGAERHFDSLQALAQQATGADIPVASLFAWLRGIQEDAPGWQANLEDAVNGRISARHIEAVQAEFKIILER